MKLHHSARVRGVGIAAAALVAGLLGAHLAPAATTNNPLVGNGVNPVIFYYDYSDDGTTGGQIVSDKTNDTRDTTPLLAPNQFFIDNGLIVETSPGSGQYITRGDDLFTTLIDGDSQGTGEGGAPTTDFVYQSLSESFALPGARAFDIEARGEGALTGTQNLFTTTGASPAQTDNQQVAVAGGYTFETYIMRTSNDINRSQIVWSPEGTHSIEIIPHDDTGDGAPDRSVLQLAIRQQARFLADVDTILPIGEWHHIMAVFDITTSPNANYSFYVDGQLIVPDVILPGSDPPEVGVNPVGGAEGVPINGPGLITLDSSPNREHGIGTQEFGSPPGDFRYLLGQLAMTRLSLGVLTPQQSLFDFPTVDEDADFDGDGNVDGKDFLIWQRGLGMANALRANGDANGDGAVTGADLAIWKNQFGQPGVAVAAGIVPEPSALALCMAAGLALAAKRRG